MTLSSTVSDLSDQVRFFTSALAEQDPEVYGSVAQELHRQRQNIELIASENIVSAAVLEAQGSVLTNKYAEGYPARRYYGGCEYVDISEQLAIDRAKELFGVEENVEPVLDLGTDGPDSVDYPDYANALATAIKGTRAKLGVVICGSGIGVSIAANRHRGIRAALCHDTLTARLARQHNDANVLAMGARIIDADVAKDCLDVFLNTEFEGGRHLRRVGKLA